MIIGLRHNKQNRENETHASWEDRHGMKLRVAVAAKSNDVSVSRLLSVLLVCMSIVGHVGLEVCEGNRHEQSMRRDVRGTGKRQEQ